MNTLQKIVMDGFADALQKNNPEITNSIDKIVERGGTMRDITKIMRLAQRVAPERKAPVLMDAIRAYALRRLTEKRAQNG